MKLVSWNVNGLRACMNKGFSQFFQFVEADIFCIQETKMQQGQADIGLEGYEEYWNSAVKKGYSGTAIFSRSKANSVSFDLGKEEHGLEGRVITLEYRDFYLVNAYAPNAQRGLARLDYRMMWQDDFCSHLKSLDTKKPVIVCGDLNVAHREIDLKNPKSNVGNAGFSPQEREKMTELLNAGFIDTFRYLNPDKEGAYTWWSYMFNARIKNIGWRIDYFLVSERIKGLIQDALIYSDVMGSDHCPIGLEISI
ncbi:MAG: exodeoxyribonuclease III [Pelotomaculaceae bacterium]|jgi:exodeoxyribonuclease-3|uniref:Apurinic/apyrimidinic endonuclease n=1 Tax=anaerobic digester metagenome TaxID=1263854 RepID=A0A485LY54_9ZZZZ